jgi:hypothetical protein
VLKALAGMVRQGRAVHKKSAGMRGEVRQLEGPRGQPPYPVEADHSLPMADVIVGPGASAILDSKDDIVVSLERDPAEGNPAPVVVYSGRDQVGTLSPADGRLNQPALDAAQRDGRSLMVHGIVSRTPGGSLQLQVYPAGIL